MLQLALLCWDSECLLGVVAATDRLFQILVSDIGLLQDRTLQLDVVFVLYGLDVHIILTVFLRGLGPAVKIVGRRLGQIALSRLGGH